MSSPPQVSIVIPVFNGAAFLTETLRAVQSQRHSNWELIVVDDASTDDSLAVVARSGVPAQVVSQANAGVSSARNRGLAASTGTFVTFLDQDDVWHPLHLERQLSCFDAQEELGAVVSPYQHWYPDAGVYPSAAAALGPETEVALDPNFTGWVFHQFLLDCWALTSATLIRRETLQLHGAFDETQDYGEDWELWLRLSQVVKFAKLNWPPVLYRQHKVQGSRVARGADHRCELLLAAAARHGLASRDGRCLSAQQFDRTIARYEMDFGYHQLQNGRRAKALRSLFKAWRRQPHQWRYLALTLAACLGWRPAKATIAPTQPRP